MFTAPVVARNVEDQFTKSFYQCYIPEPLFLGNPKEKFLRVYFELYSLTSSSTFTCSSVFPNEPRTCCLFFDPSWKVCLFVYNVKHKAFHEADLRIGDTIFLKRSSRIIANAVRMFQCVLYSNTREILLRRRKEIAESNGSNKVHENVLRSGTGSLFMYENSLFELDKAFCMHVKLNCAL